MHDDRILLVRHCKAGAYDFWVAPGGGVLDQEDILSAAVREVKEETGLVVTPRKPIYVEQFHQPDVQHIKTWILCDYVSGAISIAAAEATREYIVEARFFGKKDIESLTKPLFPEILRGQFWKDLRDDFAEFRYLGIRAMEFY